MAVEDIRRRSRWMIRALEWNDPKARYPNLWHEGMPVQIMAFDTIATRLRLGDLIAIYHPSSQRYQKRGGKFLGISRVVGLRRGYAPTFSWIDLETAHRFRKPLDLKTAPRRVFLCCDPEWPGQDADLFEKVFQAAVAEGWKPDEHEQLTSPPARVEQEQVDAEPEAPAPFVAVSEEPLPEGRLFGGVDYSGDMRDPREGTWLALGLLEDGRFRIVRLEATGRHGLQGYLRDPDRALMNVEAIGCAFPFALPLPFAEKILDGPFPDEGWWGLARKFEKLNYPDYLVAIQEFREARGEQKRLTDERTGSPSPLLRSGPDLGPKTYHGIRMIAEDRSRYVVRPFESAQGRLLLEVSPMAAINGMELDREMAGVDRVGAVMQAIGKLERLPVVLEERFVAVCRGRMDALEAVMAARAAALAVESGEADKSPEELAADDADRVKKEGWIYGTQ